MPTSITADARSQKEFTRSYPRYELGGTMRNRTRTGAGFVLLLVLTAVAEHPKAQPMPAYDQSAIAGRGYFYVGGSYVGDPGKKVMHGQMYVEVLTPRNPRHPFPLVLIHGAAQTATNLMGT